MIELMPVNCWNTPSPIPTITQAADPRDGEVGPAAGLRLLLLLGQAVHLGHLGLGPLVGADLLEDTERLVVAVLRGEPTRALRHLEHSEEQRERGEYGDQQHPAPHAVVLTPDVEDDRVDDEGRELAGDDHHLVAGDHAAAGLDRGHLGEVDRHRRGGAADGQAQDEPEESQHLPARRQHAADGAEREDAGEHQDVVPATVLVRQPPADQGADRGTEDQDADHEALSGGGQAEVVLHGLEGAVDDAGVVAEQQSAEGGDHCDEPEALRVRPRGERGQMGLSRFGVGFHDVPP